MFSSFVQNSFELQRLLLQSMLSTWYDFLGCGHTLPRRTRWRSQITRKDLAQTRSCWRSSSTGTEGWYISQFLNKDVVCLSLIFSVIIIAFSTTRCNVCICACICSLYLYSYLTAPIQNRCGVCIWACVYLYLYLQHLHRCGVCSNLVLFDNDAIAVHLKSGNHPRITHKDYNRCGL